MLILLC